MSVQSMLRQNSHLNTPVTIVTLYNKNNNTSHCLAKHESDHYETLIYLPQKKLGHIHEYLD